MITEQELIEVMKETAGDLEGRRQMAQDLGICDDYLYQIFVGARKVSKKIAEKLGYRVVKTKQYERII